MSPARPPFSRLHVEPVGGVAGDMLLAGFIDAGADLESIVSGLRGLDIEELTLRVDRVQVDGEPACYVRSLAPAAEGHGRRLADVLAIIDRAELSTTARERARGIFELLAAAEGKVHGGGPEEVHLHEVGELDSIMDVVGISIALETLGDPTVTATALPSGHGTVETRHGTLSCPVPAVREIAARANVPLVEIDVDGETVTPTGIAVLACVAEIVAEPPADLDSAVAVGVGAGTRRFPGVPNLLRVHGWR